VSLEDWTPVRDYTGLYEIHRDGRVRSVRHVVMRSNGTPYTVRRRILRPMRQAVSGYSIVVLSRNGEQRRYYTHVLHRESFTASARVTPQSPANRPGTIDPGGNQYQRECAPWPFDMDRNPPLTF
jgi:hypothetical protein